MLETVSSTKLRRSGEEERHVLCSHRAYSLRHINQMITNACETAIVLQRMHGLETCDVEMGPNGIPLAQQLLFPLLP